jgi:hypothetical protein
VTSGLFLPRSALSLLTLTFQNSNDRQKSFGIFTAIAGSGASLGLLLGGLDRLHHLPRPDAGEAPDIAAAGSAAVDEPAED